VGGLWDSFQGRGRGPNNKNEFFLEIHKRGGGGGNSPWRAHHMGERKGKESNKRGKGDWRGIGINKRGSGRLGNACQGIA
jgi:hypothetical protein